MSEANQAMESLRDPGEAGRQDHTKVDRLIVSISNALAWIFPALMLIICLQVVLRSSGRLGVGPGNQAWMDDLQWWMYGVAVLIGITYSTTTDSHVRVDIFYDGFNAAKKARTDVVALAWLFIPFAILCFDMTIHYALSSVLANEGSDSPNGLHNLWLLKVAMCLGFALMIVAGWAAYARRLSVLTTPALWKQMLYAFPATMYLVNISLFYAIWWAIKLTARDPETGEALSNREVTRHSFFEEIEFGVYEMPKTVLFAFVLTVTLILVARVTVRKSEV